MQKMYRSFEFTPVKRINDCVQSGVKSRRHGDKNPISTVAAETR